MDACSYGCDFMLHKDNTVIFCEKIKHINISLAKRVVFLKRCHDCQIRPAEQG